MEVVRGAPPTKVKLPSLTGTATGNGAMVLAPAPPHDGIQGCLVLLCVLVSGSPPRSVTKAYRKPDNFGGTGMIAQRLAVFQEGGRG